MSHLVILTIFHYDYIYLLLCTKEYHEAVVSTAAGSTVKHTSPNRIYSINLVGSPIFAIWAKGSRISIPAGSEFEIKLLEDVYLQ